MVIAGLTPREAVRAVEARLSTAGCPDADYDARELFRVAAGRDARLSDRVLTTEEAEKLEQLRAKLKEQGCTAQLVGKLDNLAWLLNLRAMDIECTPYAMAYCYVTPSRAVLFINQADVLTGAAAQLRPFADVLPCPVVYGSLARGAWRSL